jgi:hypothetical protein
VSSTPLRPKLNASAHEGLPNGRVADSKAFAEFGECRSSGVELGCQQDLRVGQLAKRPDGNALERQVPTDCRAVEFEAVSQFSFGAPGLVSGHKLVDLLVRQAALWLPRRRRGERLSDWVWGLASQTFEKPLQG